MRRCCMEEGWAGSSGSATSNDAGLIFILGQTPTYWVNWPHFHPVAEAIHPEPVKMDPRSKMDSPCCRYTLLLMIFCTVAQALSASTVKGERLHPLAQQQ